MPNQGQEDGSHAALSVYSSAEARNVGAGPSVFDAIDQVMALASVSLAGVEEGGCRNMKDHAQQQQSPVRFVIGTGAVVGVVALLVVILLHLLAVMGLMYGMGTSASVPVTHPPIKTRILPPPPP
ncbi:hypothetical protein AD928_10250, partial [Acetobacter cerevisiae]